jgi:hypothetical protein
MDEYDPDTDIEIEIEGWVSARAVSKSRFSSQERQRGVL